MKHWKLFAIATASVAGSYAMWKLGAWGAGTHLAITCGAVLVFAFDLGRAHGRMEACRDILRDLRERGMIR